MRYLLILTLLFSEAVLAAKGIPIGGTIRMFPEIGVQFKHDDNIAWAAENEVSSFITVFTPQIKFERKQRSGGYALTVGTEVGRYTASSNDNYEDISLLGEAEWQLTRRAKFFVNADYLMGHDPRGSTDRGDSVLPNTWGLTRLMSQFSYGLGSKYTIEAELGHISKRYQDFLLAEKVDDFNDTSLKARVLYRILPKINMFVETAYSMIDYQFVGSTQDSDISTLSLGAKWQATAKTTGSAQIGYLSKDFDSAVRNDFSGLDWKISVQWKASNRSTVNISTGKFINDTTGIGDVLITKDFSISEKHVWMPRISSTVGFYMAKMNFEGDIREIDRADDLTSYQFAINYDWLKNLVLSAGIDIAKRDSNYNTDDFDQNIFFIKVQTSL